MALSQQIRNFEYNEGRIKKSISSQEAGGRSESELRKAANVARSVHQSGKAIKDEYLGSKAEDESLVEHAKNTGIWISDQILRSATPLMLLVWNPGCFSILVERK